MAYRTYVTESLRLSPQGMAIRTSFLEAIRPRTEIDVDGVIEHVMSVISSED